MTNDFELILESDKIQQQNIAYCSVMTNKSIYVFPWALLHFNIRTQILIKTHRLSDESVIN